MVAEGRGLGTVPPSAPPDVSALPASERIEAMVEWFERNFEDPAEETPHDSAEGGYIYIWGGPYDANEELQDAFNGVEYEEVEAAVARIDERSGGIIDWAPAGIRIQPEGPDDDGEDSATTGSEADARAELSATLDKIDALVREQKVRQPHLGHNHPPERIEEDVLPEIELAVGEVRDQLNKNSPDRSALQRAQLLFARLNKKLLGWIFAVGGVLGKDAANDAGHAIWAQLQPLVHDAAQQIGAWLNHLIF